VTAPSTRASKPLNGFRTRLARARIYVLLHWFPVLHARRYYRSRTGKRLRYRNVKDLNEKLFWLERYWRHPLVSECTDKVRARDYVASRGFGSLLNEFYAVYDSASAIDLSALPDQFVLKCNHGCAYNLFCLDKGSFDLQGAIAQLQVWMKQKYGLSSAEWHYAKIKPRIMAEKLIPHEEYELMDYQLYCFNGHPACFLVRNDRGGKLDLGMALSYTLDWKRVIYRNDENMSQHFDDPPYREEMIRCAAGLSRDFPFVRVDFYGLKDRFYFGELTFSPIGNVLSSYLPEAVTEMGKLLSLPPKYRRRRAIESAGAPTSDAGR
jgi:hypothetical protein